jgi:hypothetical protein
VRRGCEEALSAQAGQEEAPGQGQEVTRWRGRRREARP